MRKLIMLAAFALVGFTAQAQTYTNLSGEIDRKVGGRDTLTNAATDTTYFTITGARPTFTIYVALRKISGTVAGSVRYFYSGDGGLTWYLAETDNFSDASGTFSYEKNYLPNNRWMVITQTTGTSVSSTEVWVRSNK